MKSIRRAEKINLIKSGEPANQTSDISEVIAMKVLKYRKFNMLHKVNFLTLENEN